MRNDLPDTTISKWTAEFTDPEAETEYRRRNTGVHVRQTRIGLGLWMALWLFFIYVDYANLGTGQNFWILLAIRLVIASAIFAFAIRIGRKPELATNGLWISMLLILGWTGFFAVFSMLPGDQLPWVLAMFMTLLIGQLVFIMNRVNWGAITAFYAIAGAVLSVRAVAETEPERLAVLTLMLSVPAATGLFVLHRFHFDRRNSFAMLLKAEAANAELQKQIHERSKLETELKRIAATDPLTGLYNRRRYEELFRQELRRIDRYGGTISLLVMDLDHFKHINDTYGHATGDRVLKDAADLFLRQLREVDIVGRLGGEEFIVLLPDIGKSEAAVVAERLRGKIGDLRFYANNETFRVTATIGIAQFETGDRGIEDLIVRADDALYRGKAGGRNRVVSASVRQQQ